MKTLRMISLVWLLGLSTVAPLAQAATPEIDAKIKSAMSAAPMAIAKDATIMDYPTNATNPLPLPVLRQGTNGWTCFPDMPSSPGNDPGCYDKTWMQWIEGLITGTPPIITTLGLAYMLQGGSDPSNTDPMAMEPAAGESWITTPPHVMILTPGKLDVALFGTDPKSGGPWVMFAGTPYEHIMMPVQVGTK
jgi:hypothetical protein